MSHTYTSAYLHYVFSTKGREPLLTSALRPRVWAYMGGIARDHSMKALAVGGMDDHAHILVSLPATIALAKAAQLIKGGSSKWINETFAMKSAFAWQEGYGAFSIGVAQIEQKVAYIGNQEEHHRKKSYQQEFVEFLHRHGIEYDERYVWG